MSDHTPSVNIRVPARLWVAYGRCTARVNGGRDRTEDLVRHMAKVVELLGNDADKADLAAALTELEVRRARKGGRPRKEPAGLAATAASVIIGCGSRKRAEPSPARELYTGSYFASCLAAATAAVGPSAVYVLSARYGLLTLDQTVGPYDLTIGEPGAVTVGQVASQAEALGIAGRPVTALCSARYAAVARQVWDDVAAPLADLAIGYQKAALAAMREQKTLTPDLAGRPLGYEPYFLEDD